MLSIKACSNHLKLKCLIVVQQVIKSIATPSLSICLFHLYSPKGWIDFEENFHKWSYKNLQVFFFSLFFFFNFENDDVMAANLNFFAFFKSSTLTVAFMLWFFSKLLTKKKNCVPVFDIKNKLNQFITLVSMANHVFEVY